MFRATGPGSVEVDASWSGIGTLKALLYNFDFDDFADRKFRPLKPEHIAFLADEVLPLLENNRGDIWLQGSASRIGANSWNMEVSQTRVSRVAAYLTDHDIRFDQMQVDAVGEELANKLKHSEDDPRDRSVMIWVMPKKTSVPPPKRVPPKPKLSSQSKLYIYDATSTLDRMQAAGRFSGQHDVLTIGIQKEIPELVTVFNQLLASNQHFNRVLFQTHGNTGRILFNHHRLDAGVLKAQFRSYGALFPFFTRIYFDGCNVAEDSSGTDFLLAAGEVFLQVGGGEVFGWKNLGHPVPGFLPFIGGHTIHFGGAANFKRIRFFPGGSPDWPDSFVS
jgi:hypothetical protein